LMNCFLNQDHPRKGTTRRGRSSGMNGRLFRLSTEQTITGVLIGGTAPTKDEPNAAPAETSSQNSAELVNLIDGSDRVFGE